jgi:hypothetical protein
LLLTAIDAREAAAETYRVYEEGVAEERSSQWLAQPWIGEIGAVLLCWHYNSSDRSQSVK